MTDDEIKAPALVRKRALDVTPYEHGVWCIVRDGEPFVNTIVSRKWAEDGTKIWFMLDSHNFLKAAPDEEIEVVEKVDAFYHADLQAKCLREDAEKMKARPMAPPRSQLDIVTAERDTLRAEVTRLRALALEACGIAADELASEGHDHDDCERWVRIAAIRKELSK
jgi:hypothetical protein